MDHVLFTDWDTTSLAVKEIRKGYTAFRPDCLVITHKGVEVGTIEIKPLSNTCKELVDIDVCKVAEICKQVFLSSLRLDTVDGTCKYFQHGQVPLPSFESTVADMKVFLESFLSFKERIKESLPCEQEEPSNLLDEYAHLIKPTISWKDVKEE